MDIDVGHASELDTATLSKARTLLDGAFRSFTDDDWEHALGGVHAIARDGGEVVGHAAVVPRQLLHGTGWLDTGYVEAVAVRADRRRRGIATSMMDAIEEVVRASYELGALSASRAGDALYVSRGWYRWLGPTAVATAEGVVRTPEDDGSIFVLGITVTLDHSGELVCDMRRGDVW